PVPHRRPTMTMALARAASAPASQLTGRPPAPKVAESAAMASVTLGGGRGPCLLGLDRHATCCHVATVNDISQLVIATKLLAKVENLAPTPGPGGGVMTVNGQPPMVDEQAIIMFLRQLERALSPGRAAPPCAPPGGGQPQRLHRLPLPQSLVMGVLADPRHLDRALRQAADGL